MNISALLTELTSYQKRLEEGNLLLEELNELVQLSQELLERYTILRFKAYEGKEIREEEGQNESGNENESESEIEEHGAWNMENQSEGESESESEIEEHGAWNMEKQSESESESEQQREENEEPVAFDFSLFDDTAEEVQDTILEENAVEHVSISAVTEEDAGIVEQKITMEQVIQTPTADENKAFIKHFSTIEPGFFNQIGMSRLDSLIGSFGLNERLQYINELFKGSSEAVSDAVKRLDNLGSYQDALIEASKFAHEYNWDLESETVEELVIKLKRRHG
jgi:hypothetical protein